MDFKTMALNLYPYWFLGLFVLLATIRSGYGNLVRVEKAPIVKFLKFLIIVTIWRVVILTLFASHFAEQCQAISRIPVGATLFVFWEDCLHTLPLALFASLFAAKKWMKPIYFILMAMIMFEFGSGHVYQGIYSAILLSFYIPYTLVAGRKFGFGTVMICHTLFDLTTIISIKYLLGA